MPEKMIEYDHSYDIRLEEPLSCQSFNFLIRTPLIFPVSTGSTASPSNEHCDFKIIIILITTTEVIMTVIIILNICYLSGNTMI